ncbi:hypothetical protein [Endothiovibrio diazotrophicus]
MSYLEEGEQMDLDLFVECKIVSTSIVETEAGTNVLIGINDHDNKHWLLSALSVSDFLLNEMRTQNIIDRINLFANGMSCEQDVLDRIYYLLHGKIPEHQEGLAHKDVNKVIDDINSSKRVFLEIEAVYGASVLLIARDVSLEQT